VYVLNRSADSAANLVVTVRVDGTETVQAVDILEGRWYRRVLEGAIAPAITVSVQNAGTAAASIGVIVGAAAQGSVPSGGFRRGDCDASGGVNITDAIVGLNWLFLSGATPVCEDACDSDDSGGSNITDMILILNFLFLSGVEPSPPGTSACGTDPVEDSLAACAYPDVCG
jgi:hypothetical protein